MEHAKSACPDCHHLFLDRKAVADHMWSACKAVQIRTEKTVCVHHSATSGVVASPSSRESTLELEKSIHQAICSKSSLPGVLADVDWDGIWVSGDINNHT
jgi:hypothetical protein